MTALSLVLLAILALLMLVKPDLLWKMEHFLSVRNGQATELYLAVTRVCGALILLGMAVAGIAALAGPLLG